MGKNLQRLGASLASRMKKTSQGMIPIVTELGTITQNLSLKVDGLNTLIPKGEYMVNIMLSGGSYTTSTSEDHAHKLPSVFRSLKPGDRVLVVWCGFTPAVISVITKS